MELNEKVVLKELSKIGDNIDAVKEQHKKELEAVKAELKAQQDTYIQNVADLNKDLGAKGATLEQIQAEVVELKAKGGRLGGGDTSRVIKSLKDIIVDAIVTNKEAIAAVEKNKAMPVIDITTKDAAAMTTGSLTGDSYKTYLDWRPGMEPTGQIRFRSLVATINSETDYVQYPRAKVPVGEGSFSRQASEGSDKAQIDRDFEMIDLTLKAMSGFAIVSRQALRNIAWLSTWMPTTMLENLQDEEDEDFSNSLVGAATGSSTLSGSPNTPEKLIGYITNLYKTKYSANGIAVDPAVWNDLMTIRPGTAKETYSLPNPVTVDANGNVRIIGRPVYPVNWLTGNRVVVGDWTKAAIVQSEGLTLRQTDSHNTTFIKNQVTFLLERTEGLAIFRPGAFVTAVV